MHENFAITALAALTLGCSGGSGFSSAADCEGLSMGEQADECWAQHAAEVFRTDPNRGVEIVENKVSDQRVKDFIWLTVTREVDPSSYKYCDRIQEEALAERCRVLVSRPHLHRELLKAGGGEDGKAAAARSPRRAAARSRAGRRQEPRAGRRPEPRAGQRRAARADRHRLGPPAPTKEPLPKPQ